MTPEEFVKDYSGIPENLDYIAQMILDAEVKELADVARESIEAHKKLYRALYAIGFEIG